MNFVKKLKDILFDDEDEELTEPLKVSDIQEAYRASLKQEEKEEPIREEVKPVEQPKVAPKEEVKPVREPQSERELFRSNSFAFPDFDEEEFSNNVSREKKSNVLEYERKKTFERKEYKNRLDTKPQTMESLDKKKFKPSPIISPVYGILHQDYKAEDIVDRKDVASNINIDEVRKKAFEAPKSFKKEEEKIDEPVVTFFEEKETISVNDEPMVTFSTEGVIEDPVNEEIKDDFVSIDDLIEDSDFEEEIPKINNLEEIEEELEKLEVDEKDPNKDLDDTLDTDLFELIDSMYEEKEV